ncbi:MAG: outer membrane protein transport protein [Kofleriaceae bacterium]|jgi:long-subunit fatty acid transport protein|nr:outer membrane protein transport protein [Kofleriaceae bacterium]MBP9166453.1 outer membrane protein transport protein [Kofleriaceae bacterium]MBP9860316.1 outer membrane protein transport protein [Kofleriaceae bacterium]
MLRRLAFAMALVAAAAPASASPLDLFGFGGRSPGLAGAGVASAEDFDAVYLNPAGLAYATRKRATVGGLAAAMRLELGADAYPVEGPRGLEIGGQVPMPLGGALRDRVGLGFGFYVPSEAINRARAPFPGEPSFVLLESRAFVVGLLVGVGVKVTPRLAVGLSVNALAVLRGTIDVTIDGAGRFTTQSEQRLLTRFAPILGARYRLRDDLDLGLAVRAPSRSDYDITVTSDLGDALPLTLPEIAIAGTAQYDPLTVAAEAAWRVLPSLTLTGHLAWHRWSAFPRPTRNPVEGNPPQPDLGFRDIVVPRAAVEYRRPALGGEVTTRAGYAFHLSPAPEQRGRELLLDNHRHQLGLGLGVAWPGRALPLHVDGWVQVHHLVHRRHERDPAVPGDQRSFATAGDLVVGGVTVGVDL